MSFLKYFFPLAALLFLIGCDDGDEGGFDLRPPLPSSVLQLNPGEIRYFSFDLAANQTYEIGFEQSFCAAGTSCCMMLMSLNQDPTLLNHDYLLASEVTNTPSLLVDSPVPATANVGIYGARSCAYQAPAIIAELPSNQTLDLGTGVGQLGVSYPQVDLTIVSDNFYLRDISRRASMAGVPGNPNIGAMKDDASIETHVYVEFLSSAGVIALEPLKGPQTWELGSQRKAVDAHNGSAIVYDYWLNQLNYNSFDDQGSNMLAIIDLEFPVVPQSFCGILVPTGTLYNAFWTGQGIAFTDALTSFFSGVTFDQTLSAALDVTAHEWGHAITDHHSMLTFQREPGALNEAFSDWMAAAVEHSVGETNWTIAEGITSTAGAVVFRDMQNPPLFGDPDTYLGTNWQPTDVVSCPTPDICVNDFCGVHSNSGVANKMFYLLSEGGTHNGVTVLGVGIDTAIKIAMDAQRNFWVPSTDFQNARSGMEAAAVNYGAGAVTQVQLAWQAVGVL